MKKTAILLFWALFALSARAQPQPAVTLAFDQGWVSVRRTALPALKSHHLRGIVYISTGWVGKLGFMPWDEIEDLQREGWEIGASTVNHVLATELAASEADYELRHEKAELAAHGIQAVSYGSAFGDYNNRVLGWIARDFQSHRAFEHPMASLSTRKQDQAEKEKYVGLKPSPEVMNRYPYDRYLLYVRAVTQVTTPVQVQQWLSQARSDKAWLILLFTKSDMPEDAIQRIASAVKSSGIRNVTVKEMLTPEGPRLLANGSFLSGLSGWTASSGVKVDTESHGAWPESQHAVELIGGSSAVELRSSRISVQPSKEYAVRSFVNSNALRAGSLSFAIEELDETGARFMEVPLALYPASKPVVTEASFLFRPQSARTRAVRLVARLAPDSSGEVYLDEISWVEAR